MEKMAATVTEATAKKKSNSLLVPGINPGTVHVITR
jgi:hypothetical protein